MSKGSRSGLLAAAGGLLMLSAAPVSAGPLTAAASDTGATVLLMKNKAQSSVKEHDEHRRRCWVVRDGFRDFGYFKC